MKKLAHLPLWPIKLLLALGFLGNLGIHKIPSYISHLDDSTEHKYEEYNSLPAMDRLKRDMIVIERTHEKLVIAETKIKNGIGYTIHDYFEDYANLTLYADSLSTPLSIIGDFAVLLQYRDDWMRKNQVSKLELETARNKFYDRTDPGWRERKAKGAEDFPTLSEIVLLILMTLKLQYLKNLLLALVLLLIWKYEGRERKGLNLRSPLSFVLSLIMYPITIGYVWRMKWNGILNEAEIRSRREKLFSVISSDELAIIEKLRSKLSLRDSRQELDLAGAMRRYSLITVLLAMCIMTFLPKPSSGTEVRNNDARESIYAMKSDQPVHPTIDVSIANYLTAEHVESFSFGILFRRLIVFLKNIVHFLLLKGVRRVNDPIPLSTLAFRNLN